MASCRRGGVPMVHTSLPGGRASPRQPLIAEELCLLAQVAHQARHRRCRNSNWNHHALTPAASRARSLMKAPARESITGAGRVATSQPPAALPGFTCRCRAERNRCLGAAVILRMRKGWSCCATREGMFQLPDFPGLPGISDAKITFKLPHRKASLLSPSSALPRKRDPAGASPDWD